MTEVSGDLEVIVTEERVWLRDYHHRGKGGLEVVMTEVQVA